MGLRITGQVDAMACASGGGTVNPSPWANTVGSIPTSSTKQIINA